METESSWPYSQDPVIRPYPVSVEPSSHSHILIFHTTACPDLEIESPQMAFKEYIENYVILTALVSTFHRI